MIEGTYRVKSTISVFSVDCTGLARTGHGDYIQAVPQITLTAEFDGKWDSKASTQERRRNHGGVTENHPRDEFNVRTHGRNGTSGGIA